MAYQMLPMWVPIYMCDTPVSPRVLLGTNSSAIISCKPNWARGTNQLKNKRSTKFISKESCLKK
jgi:hypothetical protein